MRPMNRYAWVVAVVAIGLALGWVISRWTPVDRGASSLSEAPRGGDFELEAPNGPFRLQEHRGKVVLIYFGYTFCPDICPTNLALMAQALNAMTEEELTRVQGVFISVDPGRDTLDLLAAYTDHFHPAIVGMTGDPNDLAGIAARYGAAYHKVEGESQGGYLVDHSSNTYVIAPDGSLHTILSHATPPPEILEVTRRLLAQTQASS
jgi:protein SCO1/2